MLEVDKLKCSYLGCIVSIINMNNINSVVSYQNIELDRKSEFHVTIFIDNILMHIESSCSQIQKKELFNFIKEFKFNFNKTSRIHFLRKDYGNHIRYYRIIELIMERKEYFEKSISSIVGFHYDIFPHITTHSFSDLDEKSGIGIGIQLQYDLEKYVWD